MVKLTAEIHHEWCAAGGQVQHAGYRVDLIMERQRWGPDLSERMVEPVVAPARHLGRTFVRRPAEEVTRGREALCRDGGARMVDADDFRRRRRSARSSLPNQPRWRGGRTRVRAQRGAEPEPERVEVDAGSFPVSSFHMNIDERYEANGTTPTDVPSRSQLQLWNGCRDALVLIVAGGPHLVAATLQCTAG
jgi:hypothetical protein